MKQPKSKMNTGSMLHNKSDKDISQSLCISFLLKLSNQHETRFMVAVRRMKQASNLCSSSDKFSDKDKDYIRFYCAVRSILFNLTKGDAPDISQINARVRELLEGAIQSDGIEELFESGKHIEVDLFSNEYINRINAIQLPNTKIKIL